MRIHLVTALLIITVTIALLLLVPLSATSRSTVSIIAVDNADARFDASMSTNPGLETAIRGLDKHTLAQGSSAVLNRSLKALPSGAWESHPKVVSLTGADSMLNLSLDISQIQARPAIGPNTRIQVQGADAVQSLALEEPEGFVVESTSTETPTQTSTPVPTPTDTPMPTVTETSMPVQTSAPVPAPTETPSPTQTDIAPVPTDIPLSPTTETPMSTVADTPLPEPEPTQEPTPTPNEPPVPSDPLPPGFYTILAAIITGVIGPLMLYYLSTRNQGINSQGSPSGENEGEADD